MHSSSHLLNKRIKGNSFVSVQEIITELITSKERNLKQYLLRHDKSSYFVEKETKELEKLGEVAEFLFSFDMIGQTLIESGLQYQRLEEIDPDINGVVIIIKFKPGIDRFIFISNLIATIHE